MDILQTKGEGFFRMDFSKFMVCPHGQGGRGLSQCGHFETRGEGQFFVILCGRLLWTAPYQSLLQLIEIYHKLCIKICNKNFYQNVNN